jgi:outer membrane protein OmpA-like peptidoglycan-associated protein
MMFGRIVKRTVRVHGEQSQGADYSHTAIGDVMSALLMTFMLVALTYMMVAAVQQADALRAKQRAEELEERMEELERQIDESVSLQRVVIGELADQLRARNIEVATNPETGDVSIMESLLFDQGQSVLKPAGRALLQRLIETYLEVIFANDEQPQYRETVVRIVIEGHTSSEGDPYFNMRLGADRATAVYEFAIRDPSLAQVRSSSAWSEFEHALTFATRGALDAEMMPNPADRRVLFRFQFRTAEDVIQLLRDAGFGSDEITRGDK